MYAWPGPVQCGLSAALERTIESLRPTAQTLAATLLFAELCFVDFVSSELLED